MFAGWTQGESSGNWSTLDLSEGGISVKGAPPEPDRPIALRLRMRSDEVHLRARLVWCREAAAGSTISGLRFIDTPEAEQDLLDRFLKRLAGLTEAPENKLPKDWSPMSPLACAEGLDSGHTAALMMLCGATAVSLMVVAGVLYLLP